MYVLVDLPTEILVSAPRQVFDDRLVKHKWLPQLRGKKVRVS